MSAEATTPPTTASPPRLLSLDAFRGLTILAMTLVNHPGSWAPGERYAPLDHAEWHGWTPTDLIFPFFLFIVGTSLAYSLRKFREGATPELYARILRRTATLFLLGIAMGLFGHACDRCFGDATTLGLDTLRYLGVLQRIALVYFAASLIALHVPIRGQIVIAAAILLGYWFLLRFHPSHDDYATNFSPEGNIVRAVDLAVIKAPHMYTEAKREKTEPEGLLSTLPAIVTALLGYWAGVGIQRTSAFISEARDDIHAPRLRPTTHTLVFLITCGVVLAVVGLLWDQYFPINKKLWTSSFVLLTGGLAMVGLAICLAVFDIAGFRRLARPFEVVGVNAITVYVGSGLLDRLLDSTLVGNQTTKEWLYKELFTDHIADPKLASLGFALMVVAVWWLIAWLLTRKGWTLRV